MFSFGAPEPHHNSMRGTKDTNGIRRNDDILLQDIPIKEENSSITMHEFMDIHRRQAAEDDIHINVVYNNHPHENFRSLNDLSEQTNSSIEVRANVNDQTLAPTSSPTSTNSEPIRIFFETSELDLIQNRPKVIKAIKNEVLPQISEILSSILSVIPATENISIPSDVCSGLYQNIPSTIKQNGVENADIVVFVSGASFINGKQFCGQSTLGSASFCNLDQIDRPVIGSLNLCVENYNHDEVDKMVKVGVHEMAHILGWNDDLFKYFRDRQTGEPLTSRPFVAQKVECIDGVKRNYEIPAENTVKKHTNWVSGKKIISYEIVTPKVKQVARNQFGCQELEGARLENQSSNSCIGAHFDERYFFTEVMSAILSSSSASSISPLTLALLEDTGFYDVSYFGPHVQNSAFGLGAGCEFITDSCVDVQSETVKDSFRPYFCDSVTKFSNNEIDQSANSTCDPSFTNIAFCDLIDFSNGAPAGYDEPDQDAIPYFSDPNLGVVFTHADYCPIPALMSINCLDGPESLYQKLYPGEVYGKASKCLNTQFNHPQDGFVKRGACLSTRCNAEDRTLVVHVDGSSLVCEFDGQIHDFPLTQSAQFECPPIKSVCPELFCPGLCSANGVCNFNLDNPRCECFDEEDESEGCYGRDYREGTSHHEDMANKPNSATSPTIVPYSILLVTLAFIYN